MRLYQAEFSFAGAGVRSPTVREGKLRIKPHQLIERDALPKRSGL